MNDADIRARLHADFDRDGVPWVDEVQTQRRRADLLAIVGGVLTSIEIKSGKDTLKRLAEQYQLADHRFRQVLVVTEPRHVAGVRSVVGPRCGIWVCEERPDGFHLRTRSKAFGTRRPTPRAKAHPTRIAYLLRRAELGALLGVDPESARRGDLASRLAAELPIEELERAVLDALRARKRESGKAHMASKSCAAAGAPAHRMRTSRDTGTNP